MSYMNIHKTSLFHFCDMNIVYIYIYKLPSSYNNLHFFAAFHIFPSGTQPTLEAFPWQKESCPADSDPSQLATNPSHPPCNGPNTSCWCIICASHQLLVCVQVLKLSN